MDSSSVPVPSGPLQNSRSVSAKSPCACAMPATPSRYRRAPRTSRPVRLSSRSACAPSSAACVVDGACSIDKTVVFGEIPRPPPCPPVQPLRLRAQLCRLQRHGMILKSIVCQAFAPVAPSAGPVPRLCSQLCRLRSRTGVKRIWPGHLAAARGLADQLESIAASWSSASRVNSAPLSLPPAAAVLSAHQALALASTQMAFCRTATRRIMPANEHHSRLPASDAHKPQND